MALRVRGEDAGSFAPYDAEAEIARGRAAMERVIAEREDVADAMNAPGLGRIAFVWGRPGRGDAFKRGYGVSHIIAKRNFEGHDCVQMALEMPVIIAKGVQLRTIGDEGARRIIIGFGDRRAILSQGDKAQGYWLLTGYPKPRG